MRDDGVLYICTLTNTADNGDMPYEVLTKIKKYWFEFRTVGISRAYQAKGVNERIDQLVRIPRDNEIEIGQIVELGNGDQYRIDLVQHGREFLDRTKLVDSKYYRSVKIEGLDYTDLTLSKLENYYAVAT